MASRRFNSFMGLMVLFVALLAVFASAQENEISATSDAGALVETSATTTNDDSSPVDAAALCYLYTSCSTCSGSCGWCGESDNSGTCMSCTGTGTDCKQPASCTAKYWTHNICPSDVDAIVLGIGAIIGIVVASIVGFCCVVALVSGLIFCLCCRTRHHTTYVVAGSPHVHHVHHDHHQQQPIMHHGYSQPGKHYNAV